MIEPGPAAATPSSPGHHPEQRRLVGQHGDVGDAIGAIGNRYRDIEQHLARVVQSPAERSTCPRSWRAPFFAHDRG